MSEKGKQWMELAKNLTMLTQLGLSLVTPMLGCVALAWWLAGRYDLGGWIYIPAFIFGLGGSFSFACQIYRTVMAKDEKEKRQYEADLNSSRQEKNQKRRSDASRRRMGTFSNRHL